MNFTRATIVYLVLSVLQCYYFSAESKSRVSSQSLEDWISSVDKAANHRHWERIVKRKASYERRVNSGYDEDDTSHIVNVQEYYRNVFSQGWDESKASEKELYNLLSAIETVFEQDKVYSSNGGAARVQEDATTRGLEFGIHTKPIKGRYIVMFNSDEGADDYILDRTMKILETAHVVSNGKVRASDMHPLRHIGKGFTVTLNSKALDLMARHPQVAHIEEDTALKRAAVVVHEEGDDTADTESKEKVLWNLDRLDQRTNVLDEKYNPAGDGEDVDIYIIDTGVRASHQEFGSRVHYVGFDAVDLLTGSQNHGKDCNGHGTHCAGTAAGKTYGVAKKANIYNLRALNCEGVGAVSGIVMGIDEIIRQVQSKKGSRPSVISQSLGVKKSATLNQAIKHATEAGIVCVGASGNQAAYSCDYSPASAKVGVAVGATNLNDEVAIFTNTGECTDIMAPGITIKSASKDCDTCTRTLSGTSMAAPHVAGYAAIVLSQNPQLSAYQVKALIIERSTKDHVQMVAVASSKSAMKTPNRLLFVPSVSANSEHLASIQNVHSRP